MNDCYLIIIKINSEKRVKTDKSYLKKCLELPRTETLRLQTVQLWSWSVFELNNFFQIIHLKNVSRVIDLLMFPSEAAARLMCSLMRAAADKRGRKVVTEEVQEKKRAVHFYSLLSLVSPAETQQKAAGEEDGWRDGGQGKDEKKRKDAAGKGPVKRLSRFLMF